MRILHCPNNISGTPKALSELERANGLESLSINTTLNKIDGPADINCKKNKIFKIIFRIKYFFLALFKFNVINCHAGSSLLPFNLDLPVLRLFGKKIIIHYYGSEVRLLYISKKINPFFSALSLDPKHKPLLDFKKTCKLKWQSLWANQVIAPRDLFYFVSRNYSKKIEKNLWCGNLLISDIEKKYPELISQKSLPVILHCPTNRDTKGSIYISSAIKKLKKDGFKFRYYEKENIDRDELLQYIHSEADIVLDQLLIGGFGNLALETLALGKISFSYLNETLCEAFMNDCPVVNVTIDTIYEELKSLIGNYDERVRLSKLGKPYIKKHLDKAVIMAKLNKIYLS